MANDEEDKKPWDIDAILGKHAEEQERQSHHTICRNLRIFYEECLKVGFDTHQALYLTNGRERTILKHMLGLPPSGGAS